jgi:hypothetical protein
MTSSLLSRVARRLERELAGEFLMLALLSVDEDARSLVIEVVGPRGRRCGNLVEQRVERIVRGVMGDAVLTVYHHDGSG